MVAKIALPNLLMPGEFAMGLGVSADKLDRWRKAGVITEFVKVGRLHLFPADKLAEVRNRLIASGHLNPERDRPFVRVPALSTATV
jgi:hypothetical protein